MMPTVLVDTAAWIALVNTRDELWLPEIDAGDVEIPWKRCEQNYFAVLLGDLCGFNRCNKVRSLYYAKKRIAQTELSRYICGCGH